MMRSFNSLPVFRKSQALIENVPTNRSRESLPPQDDFLDSGAQRDTLRAIEDDRQDDILFAVIGEDKSGISKVVELLTGIGNISCASEVQAIRIREHENLKDRVVLLVAPKLDGTLGSEKTALEQIEKWLADLRQRNTDPGISVNLRGLLSLQNHTANRRGWSAMVHHDIYRQICGDRSMKRVRLVVTNFDDDHGGVDQARMSMFNDYWSGMRARESDIRILDATMDSPQVWKVVEDLLESAREEDYDNLERQRRELLASLGMSEPTGKNGSDGKKRREIRLNVLRMLKSSLHILNNARLKQQDMKVARIRTQGSLETIRIALRDHLDIRVGEGFLSFLSRKVAQFVQYTLRKGLYGYRRMLLAAPAGVVSPSRLDFFSEKTEPMKSSTYLGSAETNDDK